MQILNLINEIVSIVQQNSDLHYNKQIIHMLVLFWCDPVAMHSPSLLGYFPDMKASKSIT